MTRFFSLCVTLFTTSVAAAADWPQWMGPNRDDVWAETGIIEAFPANGPHVLWRKPINGGFAGPAIANGKVYVADYVRSSGDEKPAPTKRNDLKGKEPCALSRRQDRDAGLTSLCCPGVLSRH